MTSSQRDFSKSSWVFGSAAIFLLVAGCGYAEYEARLAETKKYYAYLEKIEQSLSGKWSAAGNLMDLRVPNQFIPIPPPKVIKKEDGTE